MVQPTTILTVYPRTGGGNKLTVDADGPVWGLSPHGRGKHPADKIPPAAQRSIPARAGETSAKASASSGETVYPRTGGGNPLVRGNILAHIGLSPHGRGKPTLPISWGTATRSIPARAGETVRGVGIPPCYGVYPRTGGGNHGIAGVMYREQGLSPHGRGKPRHSRGYVPGAGSIPARAGETGGECRGQELLAVYPRTGGGNADIATQDDGVHGLSPHGRGKPLRRPEC